MTSEILAPLALSISLVLVVAMLCAAGLAAWRGWLGYKKLQIETAARRPAPASHDEPTEDDETGTGTLIELAAVKERLRRLEAIASGVEL